MRQLKRLFLLTCFLYTFTSAAQDIRAHETITLERSDNISLVADFYPAPSDAAEPPVIMLLHMLNSSRSAYDPLIPDLHAAGYALLNIDMRGHGESGGTRDWDAAIDDVVTGWSGWLEAQDHSGEHGLAIIGGSIGANVALISCAEIETCRGAIALSPGLDYRGVKPETALVDGLADRSALLVAAHNDNSSAEAIRRMFLNAKGDVSARMYRGRAHGTRLFDSEYESVSRLILHWLGETFASDDA